MNGGFCETDVSITVSNTTGLVPGSTANAYSRIELLNNYTGSYDSCPAGSAGQGVGGAASNSFQLWLTQPDCGTIGNKNGTTSVGSDPATPSSGDTQVRQYTMNYDGSNGAGVRWFIPLSNSSSATDDVYSHFQYDVWVYFDQASIDKVYNLEMDVNQTVGNPAQYLYIFATQCNMVNGHWQLGNGWPLTADQTCSRSQFSLDRTMSKSRSIATPVQHQLRLTSRLLMVLRRTSPVAAVRAQSMFRRAQAGEQTCLAPTSNWMALQAAAPSTPTQTSSRSTVGKQGLMLT